MKSLMLRKNIFNHLIKDAFFLSIILSLIGCGYVSSGIWEDDPGNWERVFRSAPPDSLIVIHSKYWRSPHWSYEFGYYFQIAANHELMSQLFAQNELMRLKGEEAGAAINDILDAPPEWFLPKEINAYEVWVQVKNTESNFLLFVDIHTGDLYLADYQF